jgi:hypothetical protein
MFRRAIWNVAISCSVGIFVILVPAGMTICAQQPAAATPSDPSAPSQRPLQVRTANQPLVEQAKGLADRVRQATDRFNARVKKAEDLRGKTDPIKKEIVEAYRTLDALPRAGDELLLHGEQDGQAIKLLAQALKPPLDEAVAQLRPALGSPQGLSAAVTRRAKEQLSQLRQLDGLIHQQKWALAHAKLQDILEAADDVGRFVDPKEAEPLYKPILDRQAQLMPGYLAEQKSKLVPALREEYASMPARQNCAAMRDRLAGVVRGAADGQGIRWNGQTLTGPECLARVIEEWQQLQRSVAQAAAVLHAVGPEAQTDLKALEADYDAARVQAVTLVGELVRHETHAVQGPEVERRYRGYIEAIPKLMTALHGAPEEFIPLATPLGQLAARSPETAARIQRYRDATDETLRWRRRLAKRRLQKIHQDAAKSEPLAKLLDQPPPLEGQEGPAGLKRTNQTTWSLAQPPESVAANWTEQWRDIAVHCPNGTVVWRSGADPVFASAWHASAVAESELPRQLAVSLAEPVARDLLVTPSQPPLTLEAALWLHVVTFGPYREVGGKIASAVVENLPDRLWDRTEPLDAPGALTASPLVSYPALPALVRLQVKPEWLAHELFVWTSSAWSPLPPPPPQPTSSGAPLPPAPAETITVAEPEAPPAPPELPAKQAPAAPTPPASHPPVAQPKRPEPTKRPPPPGGFPF